LAGQVVSNVTEATLSASWRYRAIPQSGILKLTEKFAGPLDFERAGLYIESFKTIV
jgi:hypothetical protein